MKIIDLIKELRAYNDNDEVFLASDEEGNEILPIEEVATRGKQIIIWPK